MNSKRMGCLRYHFKTLQSEEPRINTFEMKRHRVFVQGGNLAWQCSVLLKVSDTACFGYLGFQLGKVLRMFSLGSSLATSSELSQPGRRKLSIFRSERVIRKPNCSLCSVSASLTLTWAKPRLATLGLQQPEVAQEEADPAEVSHLKLKIAKGLTWTTTQPLSPQQRQVRIGAQEVQQPQG